MSSIEGTTHVDRMQVPLIIDTDLGGDPDDALALVVAAGLPELALVVTSDEYGDRRARLARYLLDLLDRPDVPVVAGRDLGHMHRWSATGLVPDRIRGQSSDVLGAVDRAIGESPGVRWLTIGPLSNLADVLASRPELADSLTLTIVSDALGSERDDRTKQNIRMDLAAARAVFAAVRRPWVLPSDVTVTQANEVSADSPEYAMLSRPDAPAWAKLITAHLDTFFETQSGTMQHDALALALCMRRPFIDVVPGRLELDDTGKLAASDTGWPVLLTRSADHAGFRIWLRSRLNRALDRESSTIG